MGGRTEDNGPLRKLVVDLGASVALTEKTGVGGINNSVVGYCQGLFNKTK